MDANDELRQISEVQHRLIGLYSHRSPDDVAAAVETAYKHFEGTEVRDFVPLLVERRANKTLGGTDVMADPTAVPPHGGNDPARPTLDAWSPGSAASGGRAENIA